MADERSLAEYVGEMRRRAIGTETMDDLSGKTALIVGGSSGIGRAAADLLLDMGSDVIIAGRSKDKLAKASATFASGAGARTLAFDMTDETQIAAAFEQLPAQGIDYLIVTAASVTHGPFAEQPAAEVRAMFDSKFWGSYNLARAGVPRIRDGGAIVLFSGVLSRRPGVNCAGLGAACAAVEALARGLALELGPRIRVNCIAPGMVRTELHLKVPEERRQAMFENTGASLPVGRVGLPEELAKAAVFAATNGYLTGHVIDVDGGHMIRQYATR
jgi:NAD(P)-dependent dehydrogenase (short-subunit alcohol dehydrogenase family)